MSTSIAHKHPKDFTAEEMTEYESGWDSYQFGHAQLSACSNDLQRRGWLAARRAEDGILWEEAQAYEENEVRNGR